MPHFLNQHDAPQTDIAAEIRKGLATFFAQVTGQAPAPAVDEPTTEPEAPAEAIPAAPEPAVETAAATVNEPEPITAPEPVFTPLAVPQPVNEFADAPIVPPTTAPTQAELFG